MKTMRVRKMIKEYISEKPRSTKEILDHINSKSKHGTNLQILGNILGKDKDIVKVGTTKINEDENFSRNGHYKICVWALKPGVTITNPKPK
ncbi:MAG: DUF3860 domain-containing protein [Promethearchaeota archaeon]|jgi:hypothetical protein